MIFLLFIIIVGAVVLGYGYIADETAENTRKQIADINKNE